MSTELAAMLEGPMTLVGDDGYEAEAIGHNTAAEPVADIVVGARSTADVVAAVRHAGAGNLEVAILSTGHGPIPPPAQMLINTSRMDDVTIDPHRRIATIGAGARWAQVVPAAAEHGLAPITGSSTNVGVVGYLLGGGMGPLVRSHGFSSDYVESFEIVTGDGQLRTASADQNPALYWALRGGKAGLGVVTSLRLRLVELSSLYAGSLFFEGDNIEAALRGWISWLPQCDPSVTTSVLIARFPPFDEVPAPFRGKHLLSLRFAYPGDTEQGAKLAEPLRQLAPIYLDDLGEMATTEMARISNDPEQPGPSWISARLLDHLDDDFATQWLAVFGPEAAPPPFVAAEIRQLGGAASTDVDGGSAASGRGANFSIGMVGVDPTLFETAMPETAAAVYEAIAPYLSTHGNPNFSAAPKALADFEAAFQPEVRDRLRQIRQTYDPDRVIALWDD